MIDHFEIDLPNSKLLHLSERVFTGRIDPSCSLIMESDIDINELIFRSS